MINKDRIFKILEDKIINQNCCKYLSGDFGRKNWLYFRDRGKQTTYYLINLKGNYIRGYSINYIDAGENSVNFFTQVYIPTLMQEKISLPKIVKKLIVKYKFKEYLKFIDEFIQKTPNLIWDKI